MERPSEISSPNPEDIKSTLNNMKINLTLNLGEIKKVEDMLDKSYKGILEPVRRLNNFFLKDAKNFKLQYEKILEKVSKKSESLEEKLKKDKEEATNISINEEVNLNALLANDHPKLTDYLNRSLKIISLFNDLFNTKEYEDLINEFKAQSQKSPLNGDSNIINALMAEDEDSERENKSNKKISKRKKFLNGKRKRPSEINNKNGDLSIDVNESQNGKVKTKKIKSSQTSSAEKVKNKLSDEECVEYMKNAFPDVKTISKTFLTRKLTKKVTWSSEYDFNDGDFEKNQKEIVKSATYKFIKITLNVKDSQQFNFDSGLIKIFTGKLKNYMIKLDNNNIIAIAGDLDKMELEEFLTNLKDPDLKENYKLVNAKVEIYAFFEELFMEFESDESDEFHIFKNMNDEEIEKMKSEWEKIKKLRVMWKDLKGIPNK